MDAHGFLRALVLIDIESGGLTTFGVENSPPKISVWIRVVSVQSVSAFAVFQRRKARSKASTRSRTLNTC